MKPTLLPIRALLCLSLLVPRAHADAPPPSPLQRLQALVAQRPEDGLLRFYLAQRLAANGQPDAALAELRRAAELARGLLPLSAEHFPTLLDNPAYRALHAELQARLPRVDKAEVFARLDAHPEWLPEGLAYDPVERQTFVTSMREGRVLVLDDQGRARAFGPAGEQPLLGAVVDAAARRLHLVRSNGFLDAAARLRVNRVETLALPSGAPLGRVELPEAVQLNDVCLGPPGVLFVSDSAAGRVWRVEGQRVQALAPTLPGANGLAYDVARRLLFVAHSTGIARLALDGATVSELLPRLALPALEQAGAIDGLYLVDGDLIGVQNMTTPGRVIRLRLDREGRRALALQTLLSHHHPGLDEPTTAALLGDRLRLLATTQVSRLQPDGGIAGTAALKPAVLLDLALDRVSAERAAP